MPTRILLLTLTSFLLALQSCSKSDDAAAEAASNTIIVEGTEYKMAGKGDFRQLTDSSVMAVGYNGSDIAAVEFRFRQLTAGSYAVVSGKPGAGTVSVIAVVSSGGIDRTYLSRSGTNAQLRVSGSRGSYNVILPAITVENPGASPVRISANVSE